MAHIVIIGAGLGGLPTAYELRHLLPKQHRITLISDQPKFTFIPSLPWVALDLTPLGNIQLDVEKLVKPRGIGWILGQVTALNPHAQQITVGDKTIEYDYAAIATGASLKLDAIPGLGPEGGYTHSICNPHHALLARAAWKEFEQNPGALVVGAVPGASCMGPAYEFAFLADYLLRQKGWRDRVAITFVTPEPYAGHLGIGGMADSGKLLTKLMQERNVNLIANAAITEIDVDRILLADGRTLPFKYAMLLPPFCGAKFLRNTPGLTDSQGFLPVLPTYQHPDFPAIYSLGVTVQLTPPEPTRIPLGVPKTGQMTESMAMAVAHNLAGELGAIAAAPVTPTLEAICMADFGDTGILFVANPVLPDRLTGKRRGAFAARGRWVSWSKIAFEKFFLTKMRWGMSVPWFERLGLRMLGLSLTAPITAAKKTDGKTENLHSASIPTSNLPHRVDR
jgi:sulfide:quinone oxidoreductase